jgi:hypothetical protein
LFTLRSLADAVFSQVKTNEDDESAENSDFCRKFMVYSLQQIFNSILQHARLSPVELAHNRYSANMGCVAKYFIFRVHLFHLVVRPPHLRHQHPHKLYSCTQQGHPNSAQKRQEEVQDDKTIAYLGITNLFCGLLRESHNLKMLHRFVPIDTSATRFFHLPRLAYSQYQKPLVILLIKLLLGTASQNPRPHPSE